MAVDIIGIIISASLCYKVFCFSLCLLYIKICCSLSGCWLQHLQDLGISSKGVRNDAGRLTGAGSNDCLLGFWFWFSFATWCKDIPIYGMIIVVQGMIIIAGLPHHHHHHHHHCRLGLPHHPQLLRDNRSLRPRPHLQVQLGFKRGIWHRLMWLQVQMKDLASSDLEEKWVVHFFLRRPDLLIVQEFSFTSRCP